MTKKQVTFPAFLEKEKAAEKERKRKEHQRAHIANIEAEIQRRRRISQKKMDEQKSRYLYNMAAWQKYRKTDFPVSLNEHLIAQRIHKAALSKYRKQRRKKTDWTPEMLAAQEKRNKDKANKEIFTYLYGNVIRS
jgi:alpha-D-ribose 1-methylphosphonate 5-triphosphate diphosphatase PhnM